MARRHQWSSQAEASFRNALRFASPEEGVRFRENLARALLQKGDFRGAELTLLEAGLKEKAKKTAAPLCSEERKNCVLTIFVSRPGSLPSPPIGPEPWCA